MSISNDLRELKIKVDKIDSFIADGDDISLPARQVSSLAEELRDKLDKQATIIESLQKQVSRLTTAIERIDQDAIKARNQVIYMFVAIIATLVGKVLIQHLGGF